MTTPPSPPSRIRVMLVDDHMLMRIGLAHALSSQPDIEIVAEAGDGDEAIRLYRSHRPDVVILDLRMPKKNGMETIVALRQLHPGVRIMVLSEYGTGYDISKAYEAGAVGFVMKDTPLADLLAALRKIHAGEQVVPTEIARRLAGRISSQLSSRELEVLALVGRGLSNKEISARLNIAEATVKMHMGNLLLKLGVHDRTQAVLASIKRGLITVDQAS